MAELDLAAIEARAEAATGGSWVARHDEYGDEWWFGGRHGPGQSVVVIGGEDAIVTHGDRMADAEFIAHAREDVPALVAEVRRLRAQIGGAR